jgi:hypothetical protein
VLILDLFVPFALSPSRVLNPPAVWSLTEPAAAAHSLTARVTSA